jgi:hypothetical protein
MDYVLGTIAVIVFVFCCVNLLLVILSMGAGLLSIAIRIIQLILTLSIFLFGAVTGREVSDGWVKNLHPTKWIK